MRAHSLNIKLTGTYTLFILGQSLSLLVTSLKAWPLFTATSPTVDFSEKRKCFGDLEMGRGEIRDERRGCWKRERLSEGWKVREVRGQDEMRSEGKRMEWVNKPLFQVSKGGQRSFEQRDKSYSSAKYEVCSPVSNTWSEGDTLWGERRISTIQDPCCPYHFLFNSCMLMWQNSHINTSLSIHLKLIFFHGICPRYVFLQQFLDHTWKESQDIVSFF